MRLSDIYKKGNKLNISFEVYPPKKGKECLLNELDILKNYNPVFVSLTYNAGGNKNESFELIKDIQNKNIDLMPHFTCITSSKESVEYGLKIFQDLNIKNILALRGDIPLDESLRKYDFNHANELVSFIKQKTEFSIGVAGYPEGHIESTNLKSDIDFLKKKVDAGADVIFTQLFFDNSKFYDFVERVKASGINIPIIAGIMPIVSKKQVEKMTNLAKITVPKDLSDALNKYGPEEIIEFGIDYAKKQCYDLIKNGVNGLHFYTLNRAYSVSKILEDING